MTKLTYEIYDVRTKATVGEYSDYDAMKQHLAELKDKCKEVGEYCPYSYKQVYTPVAPTDEHSKSYVEYYKNKFARA